MSAHVCFVYYLETTKHILELISLSGSYTILVCPHKTSWQNSDGLPLNRGDECRWTMNNRDFRRISRFISKTIQNMAIITMEDETRMRSIEWCHSNDLE